MKATHPQMSFLKAATIFVNSWLKFWHLISDVTNKGWTEINSTARAMDEKKTSGNSQ